MRQARAGFSAFYGEHGYKKFLARKVLEKAGLLSVVRKFGRSFSPLLEKTLPAESGLRLQLAIFDHNITSRNLPEMKSETEVDVALEPLVYFPGCSASHLYPEIVGSCKSLCKSIGYSLVVPRDLACCGVAMDAAGDPETAEKLAKKNVLALERTSGSILVSCGSCFAHLKRYVEILSQEPLWKERAEYVCERLVEINQFLDQWMPRNTTGTHNATDIQKTKVFYHDPCHLRNELNITREPRNILKRFEAIELIELDDGPQCCGQGGLFHLGAPELSAIIRDDLADKVLAKEPEIITSSCSGCLMQWKTAIAAKGRNIPVLHLAELVGRAQADDLSF
ncbi:(Fe-S)-binding protein [Desulfosediminicola flagellatus]|uniref:(Fe-S)-binding protein n=1 Tax=Desulfosediminicola flagellatus TaxID=2569541 RepID=UPI0010AD1D91|nr:(Fe-S)-binding protein [Desulfosediminicola flagellatus]